MADSLLGSPYSYVAELLSFSPSLSDPSNWRQYLTLACKVRLVLDGNSAHNLTPCGFFSASRLHLFAALSPECCGCVPAWLLTPMQAGHPFVEESAPLGNDRRDGRRLPHTRHWHRMQHRLALTQWDDRSVRQAMPPASSRGRSCWSSRRR